MDNIRKEQLVHPRETIYFVLVLLVSVGTLILLLFSIIGIIFFAVLTAIMLFLHALSMGGIRRNGVRLSENQFPELYAQAIGIAKDLELSKLPDIYILESEGILNAFATKFVRRNMVVLYSSIFEMVDKGAEKEVMFILAHEFTHLKRKHVHFGFFLLPALYIPFLGNAYMRACEYTCDRTAAYYVQSFDAAKNALTMLGIGTTLYKKVNKEAYMEQLEKESGFFVWFNEKLSTHPHLPKRIYAIESFYNAEEVRPLKESKKGLWIGIGLFAAACLVSIGLIIAVIAGITTFIEKSNIIPYLESELPAGYGDADDLYYGGYTELHEAAYNNDIETVSTLLESGADPNSQDDEGYTPLMSAIDGGSNPELLKLLLFNGADVTLQDAYGYTAFDYAESYGDEETISLLESYLYQ
ncbi:hypothetical protein CEQ21_17470 [Niallia circulans]|uniref:Peptidase M48 domain-containing protein n=1 Tax=Niallia circulans TaxID=1397 RepID=A0A553SJS4_NIACI|nr:M48 family metallopeptidase [Niallia circulans]TRZ37248.1 hypothetical protein CEQ21_17470 [Niallia circulans]